MIVIESVVEAPISITVPPGGPRVVQEVVIRGAQGSGAALPTGGTAGQYLKKNSSVNGDASWATLTLPTLSDLGGATAADINTAINNLINSAPGTLDTLGEIATRLATDESGLSALVTTVAGKEPALPGGGTSHKYLDGTKAWVLITDMPDTPTVIQDKLDDKVDGPNNVAESITGVKTFTSPINGQDATSAGQLVTQRQLAAVQALLLPGFDVVMKNDLAFGGSGTALWSATGFVLSVPAASGDRYFDFSGQIFYDADSTGKFKANIAVTGGTLKVIAVGQAAGATSATGSIRFDVWPTTSSQWPGGHSSWDTVGNLAGGYFLPSGVAGTLQFQFAPSAGSGTTCTLLAMSKMHLTNYAVA